MLIVLSTVLGLNVSLGAPTANVLVSGTLHPDGTASHLESL
jgi:hypothetical protein